MLLRSSNIVGLYTLCWSAVLLGLLPERVSGVLQTGAVDVSLRDGSAYTLLSSQAFFGKYPAAGANHNEKTRLEVSPLSNKLLCDNVTSDMKQPSLVGATVLVPRGSCTFETKAWNAQELGAAGVIVYGSLGGRYFLNETKAVNKTDYNFTEDDIVYPLQFWDYDCSKGSAEIPSSAIKLNPLPYNSENNDPVLSGTDESNLCKTNSEDGLQQCSSGACFLTGEKTDSTMKACCAWDFHIYLPGDPAFTRGEVTIPATYVTMEQGKRLLSDLRKDQVYVTIYSRPRPDYNPSSILIWMLGVFVAALAAFLSADDYHRMIRKILRKQERAAKRKNGHANGQTRSDDEQERDGSLAAHNSSPPMQMEESLELTVWHALGFVVMASSALLVLFYFKIYRAVKVFYAVGCSKAISQIIFFPLCWRIGRRLNYRDRIVWRTGTEDFGDITVLDIISHCLGFSLGIIWLVICFTVRHPEQMTFYWVMQDVFGAAMCISFLAVIKLNSLKVAASLLIMAFFYDIFMVFISPFFFGGKSVMITVATSGGPPSADPAWCEKYPDDANCQGGEPLPMLFQIPRLFDYQGGSSLLGLGDIVLPGLLVSLAARLDAAKSLLGLMGGGSNTINSYGCPEPRYGGGCSVCKGGYFVPSVIAYAVGLLMANMAVYLMNMGQPALLYLVPCCLGTMSFMAWRRNEFYSLWEGPKAIRTVDELLYGPLEEDDSGNPNNAHAPLPLEDGLNAPSAPSAQDEGDLPLVSVQDESPRNVI